VTELPALLNSLAAKPPCQRRKSYDSDYPPTKRIRTVGDDIAQGFFEIDHTGLPIRCSRDVGHHCTDLFAQNYAKKAKSA
jgi:hypothetical protein